MKKITLLIAALAISAGAFAQEWDYGLKAGVNFSKVTKMTNGKAKTLPGFYAGVFAEYQFNNWFGIQPELVYSTQGTKFNGSADAWKFELRENYINLPVLAKFYVANGLSVDLGPQLGFLVSNKTKVKTIGAGTLFTSKVYVFDFAFAMGLSYTISDRVDITARYNLGLSDVYEYEGKNMDRVLQLGVGYRF